MAEDDSNLKIGIGLDTSKLPGEARRAERTIKEAVDGATEAVEKQGKAAEQTGQAHTEAAQAATAGQQQAAQAVEDTTAAVEEQQAATQKAVTATADGIKKTTTTARSSIQQVSKDGTKAVGELSGSIGKGTEAVGGFTKALNIANGVMGVLSKTFAVIGLINQVATSLKLIVGWWKEMNAKAVSAGQKFAAAWRQQREEARKLRDQNAALEALEAQEAAHDRILAKMREQASHEAKMRGMRARAAGNADEAEKATLDGMLARNEISEAEHIDRTRAIDDRATERRQADELAEPLSNLATATEALSQKQTEATAATDALNTLLADGMRTGIINQSLQETDQLQRAGTAWANATESLERIDGVMVTASESTIRNLEATKKNAEDFVRRAADMLHISTTREKDGKIEDIPITELATAVQNEWNRRRAALRDAANAAQGALGTAKEDVERAQDVVDAKKGEHEAENAARDAVRQQQDLTLAWSTQRAATEAHTEALRAATEATREEQREELTQRHDAAIDAAEDARSTYSTSWAMEQERATAEQAPAMAAINSLLARAEKEPRVLEQLQAMFNGHEVTLTEDEARRYGQDFQLAKNGGLTGEQQAAISTVVTQLMTAMQAEADAKQVGEEMDAFTQQDDATARAAQNAELDRLRAEADAAQKRADEATARLQRYETAPGAAPAAPAPATGAAPAVPEPAPMPPVDEALSKAGDVVAQHNDMAAAVMGAMGQFNATTSAAVVAIGAQRGQLAKLTAENHAMQQQLANLTRASV